MPIVHYYPNGTVTAPWLKSYIQADEKHPTFSISNLFF